MGVRIFYREKLITSTWQLTLEEFSMGNLLVQLSLVDVIHLELTNSLVLAGRVEVVGRQVLMSRFVDACSVVLSTSVLQIYNIRGLVELSQRDISSSPASLRVDEGATPFVRHERMPELGCYVVHEALIHLLLVVFFLVKRLEFSLLLNFHALLDR